MFEWQIHEALNSGDCPLVEVWMAFEGRQAKQSQLLKIPSEKKHIPVTKFKQFHLLQPQFLLNKIFEFIGTTTCSFDDFCLCIDKMVFDEIEAGFNISVFEFNEVKSSCNLFLNGYFIQRLIFYVL